MIAKLINVEFEINDHYTMHYYAQRQKAANQNDLKNSNN